MKISMFAASLLALGAAASASAADVGVSINVGQPGFYGRIDIGDFPQPRVLYAQPVIVQRPVRYIEQQPIYLRVPARHSSHWSQYCRSYNACGQRVYFVQDNWYTNDYAPRYRQQHGYRPPRHEPPRHEQHHEPRHEQRFEHRNEQHGRRDERGERHDNGRGPGREHGEHNGRRD